MGTKCPETNCPGTKCPPPLENQDSVPYNRLSRSSDVISIVRYEFVQKHMSRLSGFHCAWWLYVHIKLFERGMLQRINYTVMTQVCYLYYYHYFLQKKTEQVLETGASSLSETNSSGVSHGPLMSPFLGNSDRMSSLKMPQTLSLSSQTGTAGSDLIICTL